jgi:hypothetical protein
MPMASMLAPSQHDWDRNAYHVRKGVVLMFRSTYKSRHVRCPRAVMQLTFQRARTEEKKRQRAAALVEAARSLAPRAGKLA